MRQVEKVLAAVDPLHETELLGTAQRGVRCVTLAFFSLDAV
jgi:hypothetical protein